MDHIIDGVARFRSDVFPRQRPLYQQLVKDGQHPKALVISCSDSRVVPEIITQSDPGDMFVCRNAGNIVPPYGDMMGGVTAAIEYAVVGLGVEHIVICGHSDCGAMKALLHPEALAEMPNVAAWLGHCKCAQSVFLHAHDGTQSDKDAARVLAMENVVAQLTHLRTHPCVAARVATGQLALHGWLFDIESGTVLAVDGETGIFSAIDADVDLPVALPVARRVVHQQHALVAAE
jgi:carbonic anhydrase